MLANKQLTDDRRLQGLWSFPFRLPEAARAGNFAQVSAAELALLVQQERGLDQYEFVQMARFTSEGAEERSAETPRQQREPRAAQHPAAAPPPLAAPRGVQQRPALAQLPFQAPAGTGEQPPPTTGTYAPSSDRLPQLAAGTLKRSPIVRTEAANAHGVPTSVWRWAPHIVAISLFVFGLIAMVVRVHRR